MFLVATVAEELSQQNCRRRFVSRSVRGRSSVTAMPQAPP